MKIIGITVGMGLPKPNLMQSDPKKGDYVKGKEDFVKETVDEAIGDIASVLDAINGEAV